MGTSPGSATQQDALYRPTRNAGDRAVATAGHCAITGLHAEGKTIYWHHAGALTHESLP